MSNSDVVGIGAVGVEPAGGKVVKWDSDGGKCPSACSGELISCNSTVSVAVEVILLCSLLTVPPIPRESRMYTSARL